jgi:tetratricopeptide (TPR) repeat protein
MSPRLLVTPWIALLWAASAIAETTPPAAAEPPPSAVVQQIYGEAIALMNENKLDDALAKLDTIPTTEAAHTATLNLRGALHVRKKNYPAAQAAFAQILEKDPKNSIGLFNAAEVHFLKKEYPKAREFFTAFLQQPGNSQNALGRYKIFLSELLGADKTAALKTLASLEPTISHPFYYFAHAADEFQRGQDDKAREYIQSAFSIYPGGLNAAFADSFVELGWLKPEEIAQIGTIDSTALQSLSTEFKPTTGAAAASAPATAGFENLLPDFAREKETPPPAKP